LIEILNTRHHRLGEKALKNDEDRFPLKKDGLEFFNLERWPDSAESFDPGSLNPEQTTERLVAG
jgi:hypothetical protein